MSEFHLPDSLVNLFGKKKPPETAVAPVVPAASDVENTLQVATPAGKQQEFKVIYEKGAEPVSADSLKNLAAPAEVQSSENVSTPATSLDEEMAEAETNSFVEGFTEARFSDSPGLVNPDVSPAIAVPDEPTVSSVVKEQVSSSKKTDEKMTKYDQKAEREGWDLEEYERIKGEIVQLKEMRKKVNDSYLSQSDKEYINQRWEHYQELQKNSKGNGLAQFELVFIRARVKALHEYRENESNWNWRWSGKDAVNFTSDTEKESIKQARIDRLQVILRETLQPFPQEAWYTAQDDIVGETSFANADSTLAASRKALKKLLRERLGVVDEAKITEVAQRFFARKNNTHRAGIAPRDDIEPSGSITPDVAISPEPDDSPANPDSGIQPESEGPEEKRAVVLDLVRKLRDRKAAEEQQRVATEPETPQPEQPVPADAGASPTTPATDTPSSPETPPAAAEALSNIPKKDFTETECSPLVRVNHDGIETVIFNPNHNIQTVFELSALKSGLSNAIQEGENWKFRYTGRLDDYQAKITNEQKSLLEAAITHFESNQDDQGHGDISAPDVPEAEPRDNDGLARRAAIDALLKSSEFKGLFANADNEIFTGELLTLLTEVTAANAQDKRIQLLDALYHHPTFGSEFKNILHNKMRVIQLNAFMDKVYGSESGKDAVVNWNADGSQNTYRKDVNRQAFDEEWAKVPQLNRAQRLFARMRTVFTNQGVPRAGETTFEESVVGRPVNPSTPEAQPERHTKINKKRAIAAAVVVTALATLSSVTVANKGENDTEKDVTANPTTAVLDAEKMQAVADTAIDNLTPQEEAIASSLSDDQIEELAPIASSGGKWEATRLPNGDISLISEASGESVTVHLPPAEELEVQNGPGVTKIGAEPIETEDHAIKTDEIAKAVIADVMNQSMQEPEQVKASASDALAETPTMFSTSIWNKLATELPLSKALKEKVVFDAIFQSDLTVEQRNEGKIAGRQLIDVLKDANNAFLLLSNRDVDLSSVGKGSKLITLTGVTDITDVITIREKHPEADGAILDKAQNDNLAEYTLEVLQKAAKVQTGEGSELTDFEKWVVERLNGHPDFGGPGWIPDPDKRTVAHAEDLVQPGERENLQRLLDIANGATTF